MSLGDTIRKEFTPNKVIELSELYRLIEEEFPDIQKDKLHHRARAKINSMKNAGIVKHVGPSKYTLNEFV